MATAREFIAAAFEELPKFREDVESFPGPCVQIRFLADIAQNSNDSRRLAIGRSLRGCIPAATHQLASVVVPRVT
jgi:hypothetical protein